MSDIERMNQLAVSYLEISRLKSYAVDKNYIKLLTLLEPVLDELDRLDELEPYDSNFNSRKHMSELFQELDLINCPKCGGDEVRRVGDDAIDYCKDCGVVEGIR